MKKLFFLFLILASNLFGQGWNGIVTVQEIEEPNMTDIFTNSSGIHILIRDATDGDIIYYNLNSAGTVCTTKTCTLETSGSFPNIIGTNDKIYAVYKTGNNMRVRYSTDNGSNWLTNIEDRPTTENDCNGIDAVYEPNYGVHIVWATRDGGTSGYETYYRRLAPDNSWADAEYKNVTDYSTPEYGGNPNVVVSPSRVHVSYNTDATTSSSGPGDVKTRDKYNGNWEDPQSVVPDQSSSEQSLDERLLVRDGYLYLFYNRNHPTEYPHDLVYKTRPVGSTSWSNPTTIETAKLYQSEDAFEITKTTNDYIHIVFKKYIKSQPIGGWAYTYKYYDGENWSTQDGFDYYSVPSRQIGLSSVSNDLFNTWVKLNTPYLRYRQYDAKPLAPQNLTVYKSEDNHPYLSWDKNNEPDLDEYHIYKFVVDWNYLTSTDDNYFEDTDEEYCTAPPPQQCTNEHNILYRIKAEDIGNNESDPSNTVTARVLGGPPAKASINDLKNETVTEYSLDQNYPNPFNPSTTISYSIKSDGVVNLKVFDMLGKEVASLVDGRQEAGNFSVTFNASNLPSGIYVYRITANDFTSTKKLILVK